MEQKIALITAAQRGDLVAFTQLVTQFQNMAYAIAYSATNDPHLAEEAAQEAFIEVYRHLGQLEQPAAFPGWLRTIVLRRVNRLTRRKALPIVELAAANRVAGSPTETTIINPSTELRSLLHDAISALPAHERPVVLLYYLADYSQQAIAELLGIQVSAVKNRLYSARKRLRERIQTMLEETLQRQCPSQDAQFVNKVLAMLKATAEGDTAGVTSLLAQTPALLNAAGPVDYWSIPQTPLHVALTNHNFVMFDYLLAQGADINAADPEGQRPIHLVMHNREMVDFLMQRGAVTDIFVASALGDLERVSAFLAADPSLARAHGPEGATPLHLAATIELAQLLLDHGADINVPDHYTRRPPVGWGWGPKRDPVRRFLIEKGARVDTISLACRIGDVERVRAFLDADPALLYTRTPTWDDHGEGATLLHIAVSRNRYGVAQLLIERGADVNAKGGWWVVAPLHWAADNGHTEVVRLLIAHGADVNARTEEHGYTPLHWAAGGGHCETVRLLIAAGADVNAQSDSGERPNLLTLSMLP